MTEKRQTLGGFFTDVRAVEGVNSHPWWDGSPSLSHNGETLYFDSTRIGRKDLDSGRDLFMATRLNDGGFGDVIPLADLNTDVNESGFVLAPDGRKRTSPPRALPTDTSITLSGRTTGDGT